MFQPTGLGEKIFRDRYAFTPEETWDEACVRVAYHVARGEEGTKVLKYGEEFRHVLTENLFMPAGRIWYGAGKPKAQLLNCFVVPTEDSREGWGKTTSDVIVISGLMGGVGMNFSPIRPRGSKVKGTGGYATGPVSLMKLVNGVGDEIQGGGGRRMALMEALEITHPNIGEFLDAKLDKAELNNANCSVIIPHDMPTEQFVDAIKNGGSIKLMFNGQYHGEINAAELWDRLVKNSWEGGDPGVLNAFLANKMSNVGYIAALICTNPCGEIWLMAYDCCCLGALVLPRFVRNGVFDWELLIRTVSTGVRFLDDVLTVNHYPLPEIKAVCENIRRIGLGVMGLHTMLLELGMKYDSPKAFEFVDRLFRVIKETAYRASISLAQEKGPFPGYDGRFLDSKFVETLSPATREYLAEYGIRNCAILTIPPTGTTSMVAGVSSGIEVENPPVYWRTFFADTQDGTKALTRELVVSEAFHKYPDLAQSAVDVPVRAHFEMQKIVQKHIDNAVSKTINLPNDFPQDQFGDIWLEYLPFLKGTTVYRYGSRENEPIQPIPREKWAEVIDDANRSNQSDSVSFTDSVVSATTVVRDLASVEAQELIDLSCPTGVCDLPPGFYDRHEF